MITDSWPNFGDGFTKPPWDARAQASELITDVDIIEQYIFQTHLTNKYRSYFHI